MKKTRVCVVIPAYNEEKMINEVAQGISRVLSKSPYDFEIVVINDGSKDGTSQSAKKSARVIDHILNTGSGGATATGLSYANQNNFDMAATMDADGQHDPEDVVRGFEIMQKNNTDLLIGSRLINSKGMSRTKVLGNRGLSTITYLLFGIHSTDSQSGLRIFSRNSLEQLRWKTSGYEFCSEMLWRAHQLNLKIGEYPITAIYTDYSMSKGQSNWNAFNILSSLFRQRVRELFSE